MREFGRSSELSGDEPDRPRHRPLDYPYTSGGLYSSQPPPPDPSARLDDGPDPYWPDDDDYLDQSDEDDRRLDPEQGRDHAVTELRDRYEAEVSDAIRDAEDRLDIAIRYLDDDEPGPSYEDLNAGFTAEVETARAQAKERLDEGLRRLDPEHGSAAAEAAPTVSRVVADGPDAASGSVRAALSGVAPAGQNRPAPPANGSSAARPQHRGQQPGTARPDRGAEGSR